MINIILLLLANIYPLYGITVLHWSFTLWLFFNLSEVGIICLVYTAKFLKDSKEWNKSTWMSILKFHLIFWTCMAMYLGFMLLIFVPIDPEMNIYLQQPMTLIKEIGWAYALCILWHSLESFSYSNKRLLRMTSILDIFAERIVLVHLVIVLGGIAYIELSKKYGCRAYYHDGHCYIQNYR